MPSIDKHPMALAEIAMQRICDNTRQRWMHILEEKAGIVHQCSAEDLGHQVVGMSGATDWLTTRHQFFYPLSTDPALNSWLPSLLMFENEEFSDRTGFKALRQLFLHCTPSSWLSFHFSDVLLLDLINGRLDPWHLYDTIAVTVEEEDSIIRLEVAPTANDSHASSLRQQMSLLTENDDKYSTSTQSSTVAAAKLINEKPRSNDSSSSADSEEELSRSTQKWIQSKAGSKSDDSSSSTDTDELLSRTTAKMDQNESRLHKYRVELKRKRDQASMTDQRKQGRKMQRMHQKSFKASIGSIVSLHIDSRDATGRSSVTPLCIVFKLQPETGGAKLVCVDGVIGNTKGQSSWRAVDGYSVLDGPTIDPALSEIRNKVLDDSFRECDYKVLTDRKAQINELSRLGIPRPCGPCRCKGTCSSIRCGCKKQGAFCTDSCNCTSGTCQNRHP